jgi:hypothetical protein
MKGGGCKHKGRSIEKLKANNKGWRVAAANIRVKGSKSSRLMIRDGGVATGKSREEGLWSSVG